MRRLWRVRHRLSPIPRPCLPPVCRPPLCPRCLIRRGFLGGRSVCRHSIGCQFAAAALYAANLVRGYFCLPRTLSAAALFAAALSAAAMSAAALSAAAYRLLLCLSRSRPQPPTPASRDEPPRKSPALWPAPGTRHGAWPPWRRTGGFPAGSTTKGWTLGPQRLVDAIDFGLRKSAHSECAAWNLASLTVCASAQLEESRLITATACHNRDHDRGILVSYAPALMTFVSRAPRAVAFSTFSRIISGRFSC